jgi:DNA-binding response OmpR family regulator
MKKTNRNILYLAGEARFTELVEQHLHTALPKLKLHLASGQDNFLQLIKTRHFDLVLLDYVQPDIDGLKALERCRELLPHTPVIVLSDKVDEEDIIHCLKQGAAEFVSREKLSRLAHAIDCIARCRKCG